MSDIGYLAHPFDPARSGDMHKRERNTAIKRLAVAGLGMMQVMMYALPAYSATDLAADTRVLMRWASLILTIPVVGYSAWPFFVGAWRDLKRRTLGMDVPVGTDFVARRLLDLWCGWLSLGSCAVRSVALFKRARDKQ